MADMDEEVVKLLQHHADGLTLFQLTKHRPNLSTLLAIDEITFHRFNIDVDNLATPFAGELKMRIFNCLEPPTDMHKVKKLEPDYLVYVMAQLAESQRYPMRGKTLIFDYNIFYGQNVEMKNKAYNNFLEKQINIFDKEILLMPTNHNHHSFLTVIFCPRGALVDEDGTTHGTFEIFHFGTYDTEYYSKIVTQRVFEFLVRCAKHFEPKEKVDEGVIDHRNIHIHDIRKAQDLNKEQYILEMINRIMKTESEFPDMDQFIEEAKSTSARTKSRRVAEFRKDMFAICFAATCQKDIPRPVMKHLLITRERAIQKYQEDRNALRKVDENVIWLD